MLSKTYHFGFPTFGRGPVVAFSLPEDHPLKDDPEMALILGYCLSEWDWIEHAMVLIFTGLLDTDYFKAERVFWSQRGLSSRCDMIGELCKHPGVIDKELHDQIAKYLRRIRKLAQYRNLLVHGVWFKDGDTGELFRAKVRPDMLMYLHERTSRFNKNDIKKIGADFTELRREFVPFAIKYHSSKLSEMVAEKMAVAKALNRGTTITLGKPAGAASELEASTTVPDDHGEAAQAVKPEGNSPRSTTEGTA